jgi:hypothetical protein
MKLIEYLKKRGIGAYSLTMSECEAFGIPYPLVPGWPERHADLEITPHMVDTLVLLAQRRSKKSAAIVMRALHGAFGGTAITPPQIETSIEADMSKTQCLDYVNRAMDALEDMREALEDASPDAALAYLEAAHDVQDLVSHAVLEAMRSIIENRKAEKGNLTTSLD